MGRRDSQRGKQKVKLLRSDSMAFAVARRDNKERELQEEEGNSNIVYTKNARGLQLFSCRWVPFPSPKALVFLCHGYAVECSRFMRVVAETLANAGYAVFGLDYEGHGRSAGSSKNTKENLGSYMGIQWEAQCATILVAPMCKISAKLVKPFPIVVNVLTKFEDIIPKWKIVPTKNIISTAFKDRAKREAIRNNKLIYQDKPRLKTAMEMIRTGMSLEDTLHEVTIPLLVLQGGKDKVTDPEISRALCEKASSKDKTIKMYMGMCHGVATEESDENIMCV
ncbi:Caffeoylshikimate esterase [Vigna angularis]|uniref:Caffeoylshikimate esterase n=1 Tax=Phaseolus angularis TaxID=3914 RepID=A0A8T0KUD9_PHAAN|nr:Caffeoylshikimate esterase [Vigna angularis]